MKGTRQLRFGYLAQIASFISLALVNIALPNLLGVTEFAKLAEALAFISVGCVIFNDGVSYLIIRQLSIGTDPALPRRLYLQTALEHALLGTLALSVVIVFVEILRSGHHYSLGDWILMLVTGLLVAAYVPLTAILTGTFRTQAVLVLSLLNGFAAFLFPWILNLVGLDVRIGIFLSYASSYAVAIFILARYDLRPELSIMSVRDSIVITNSLLPLVAPTALRVAMVSLPVLALTSRGQAADAASYKIATAMIIGALAFVPFSKQAALSVGMKSELDAVQSMEPLAVFISGVGAILLAAFAPLFTSLLFPSGQFKPLATWLSILSPLLVLQAVGDILLVELIRLRKEWTAFVAVVAALAVGGCAMAVWGASNFALTSASVFCMAALIATKAVRSRPLLLIGAIVATISASMASYPGTDWTKPAAFGLLVAANMAIPGLRRILISQFRAFFLGTRQ